MQNPKNKLKHGHDKKRNTDKAELQMAAKCCFNHFTKLLWLL
jgi:hypothetical protein